MKIIENSITVIIAISIWFTILFDPTNLALGTKLFILPDFMLGLAEIFGNIIWVLGVLFLIVIMVIMVIMVALFSDEDLRKTIRDGVDRAIERGEDNITPYTITNKKGDVIVGKFEWRHKILFPISCASAIIAMGSGFWFTGTTWLLLLLLLYVFRKVNISLLEEIIKEKQDKKDG